MKILVTCHGFLTPSMTFVYNQIKAFQEHGHKVEVVACALLNEELFPFDNVTIYRETKDLNYILSAFKRKLGIEYTFFSTSFSQKFENFVAEFNPDIIHCHFGTHFFRLGNYFEKSPIPTIITFHGYDASQALTDQTYCEGLRNAFKNPLVFGTAVSQAIKNNLLNIGLPSEKIKVDYLGVDLEFFKRSLPRNFKKNEPATFLQISNFVEKKGHQYTIRAFRKYLDKTGSNDVLIFGGTGPLYDEMVSLTKKFNLENNIVFKGLIDRFRVKELMENAHFFVHHSVTAANGDTEGLPTVLMEAMAMDLPCISTFHSGIPEIIENSKNGILVEERDVDAMAQAFTDIKSLFIDPRNIIIEKFNLKNNTLNIVSLFEKLIAHNERK
ncbi:glycosyltransferase [Aequorivita todarodis]|uniref:glycosyltransferase n=1 Tax=Aequorivita todarodis TaxID=2036821 RepID=UPI00235003C4|nr:glycosyltransferase [Aequorivita todarodis]MDC8002345.1 glycosyltransferase [Aequorivita todarodis]